MCYLKAEYHRANCFGHVAVGSSTNIGISPAVHAHYVTCCFAMQNVHRAADRHIPLLGPQRLGPVSLGSQPSALSSSRRVLQLPTCLLYMSAMATSGLAPERDFQLLVGFFVVHRQVLIVQKYSFRHAISACTETCHSPLLALCAFGL